RRAREVEEVIARRLVGLALEQVALVEAIERRLDDAGVLTRLDPLLQPLALRTAGDVHQRGHPVEGGEQLVVHRTRLDDPRPADDHRRSIAALPGFAFLTL